MTERTREPGRRVAVFAATSGHSGVDRALKNLIPALAARGHSIDVLQVRGHGPRLEDLPAGVRLIDLGSRHVYGSFLALVRYLRRERPYALLSDKDRVNRTALLAREVAGSGTRVVVSLGTTVSIELASRGPFERWLQRSSMKHLYPLASRVVVTSGGVAEDLSQYTGLPRSLIEVVPSPVVPTALLCASPPRPDHPWFRPDEPPVILGVGELSARKDFETLVRAFALVRRSRSCRLLILGKGKRRDRILALAAELGVGQDVDLAGFKPEPYSYMAHAAVFALSSRWEGLGFVVVEALAVGTPVVSTDCPSGPREILQDGHYGRLVPVGDYVRMAEAIEETMRAPPDRKTLREGALPYTIDNSADCYLRVLGLSPEPQRSAKCGALTISR